MDAPSTSKENEDIALESDSEHSELADVDEVMDVDASSDGASSSDEVEKAARNNKPAEKDSADGAEEGSEENSDEEDEDEEEGESRSESESLESEEEEENEDEENIEDEQEDESEGDDPWDSGDEQNVVKPSLEANEAKVLRDFHEGLDHMLNDRKKIARKAFEKVLESPMIASFHQNNVNWEVEHDDKLSKMARLFVGCHKNLAALDKENKMEHLLQVLSLSPNGNSSLWLDLGFCSLEKGDPALAKYAFKRAKTEDGDNAFISVLFLTGEYHACLEYIKIGMDKGYANKMLIYLKERVRNVNDHFRQYHDDLFQEDRDVSDFQNPLTEEEKREFGERLNIAQEKYCIKNENKFLPLKTYEPIKLDIDFDLGLQTVCTIFCDLYDRIEAYSNLARQKIHFRKWDNHQIYLDSVAVVENLICALEAAESAAQEREEGADKTDGKQKSLMLTDRRKSARMMERWTGTPENPGSVAPPPVEDPQPQSCLSVEVSQNFLPATELSTRLKFNIPYIVPLFSSYNPTRTPTPPGCSEYISESFLLSLIRQSLMNGTWTCKEIIDVILLNLADVCPVMGALPKHLHEVLIQLYRRLNRMCSDLNEEKYLKLHVLMDDLGDYQGRDYSIRWHLGDFEWPNEWLALRYAWNCARFFTRETSRLEYLELMAHSVNEENIFMTANGPVSLYDVQNLTEKVAKVERIRSIKLYVETNMHEEVVKIMRSDIEFSAFEDAEIPVMLNYWFTSLVATERFEEAASLICRVIAHYLAKPELDTMLPKIMDWYEKIHLDSVSIIGLSSLAFIFCHVIEKKKTYWMYWKKLYEIIRTIEGPVSADYISSLTASSHDDALPLLSLELLMKAHEALGFSGHCATQNDGEFLVFMMKEINKMYENKKLVKILLKKENAWIHCNLSEEIDQCLHCGFGRYSKRRKQMTDHHHRAAVTPSSEIATVALNLALPRPLPGFEDKERLGHDVPELIISKFPKIIDVSVERKKIVLGFKEWLKKSRKEDLVGITWPVLPEIESELQASIWYIMALSSFRQNCMGDNQLYCQLFLTSGRATKGNPATTSTWAMLAHSMICELFKLNEEQMFKEWEWRTMPYRIGIDIDNTVGILHFQLGNSLYQTATAFKRHLERHPADHPLQRHRFLIENIRIEAKGHFEICVQIPAVDNKIEEFQWLSFFFLAKLYAKMDEYDVIKVVDNFFEAACSCELGDFFWYPLKINLKKQANLEPVELHYQLFSAIWKYLKTTPDPDEDTLLTLLSYAHSFQQHKVVRSPNSLFRANPEIREILFKMCVEVDRNIGSEDDVELTLNRTLNAVELVDELWNLCYKGFELVSERFPHHKAAYRLAEMELDRKNYSKALELLLRGVFRRRKKEDGFFENILEISSPDITRSGSFEFHVERSTALLLRVLLVEKDVPTMLCLLQSLIILLGEKDESHISPPTRHTFLRILIPSLEKALTASTHSPKHFSTELVRIWQKMEKLVEKVVITKTCCGYSSCAQMRMFKGMFQKIIQPKVGDLDKLLAQQNLRDEMAKKTGRKRKGAVPEVDFPPKRITTEDMAHPAGMPSVSRTTATLEENLQFLVASALIQSKSL